MGRSRNPAKLDARSIAAGRRLEREDIARGLMDHARRSPGITNKDRGLLSQLATAIWAGKMSKHGPSVEDVAPWVTAMQDAVSRADTPPFDPDPELIAHAEGNRRSLRGYRRKAEEMRVSAGQEKPRP